MRHAHEQPSTWPLCEGSCRAAGFVLPRRPVFTTKGDPSTRLGENPELQERLRGPAPRGYNGDVAVLVQMAFVQAAGVRRAPEHAARVYVDMIDGRGTPSVNGSSSPIRHRGYVTYRHTVKVGERTM